MVDHPESFAPEAVAAAAYFLDEANAGQADALETSRERYAEDKYNPDGEISKEDIESELAHLGDTEQAAPQTEDPNLLAYQFPQYPDGSDGAPQDNGTVGDAAQPHC